MSVRLKAAPLDGHEVSKLDCPTWETGQVATLLNSNTITRSTFAPEGKRTKGGSFPPPRIIQKSAYAYRTLQGFDEPLRDF